MNHSTPGFPVHHRLLEFNICWGFNILYCMHAQLLSSVGLCDPMDCSLSGSSVHGVSHARILEWVAISSFPAQGSNPHLLHLWHWQADSLPLSHLGSPPTYYTLLLLLSRFSRVRLCATPETAALQAPLSLGFSRQEHWTGLPFPSPMHESEKWKGSRSVVSDS